MVRVADPPLEAGVLPGTSERPGYIDGNVATSLLVYSGSDVSISATSQ